MGSTTHQVEPSPYFLAKSHKIGGSWMEFKKKDFYFYLHKKSEILLVFWAIFNQTNKNVQINQKVPKTQAKKWIFC